MIDIALLTDRRWVKPVNLDQRARNIVDEEGLLQQALRRLGCNVQRLAWDDPEVDWAQFRVAVFRSTWDYIDRIDEFRAWLSVAAEEVLMQNPVETIRWNMDKHYLLDLQQADVPVVPSMFVEAGSQESLAELVARSGWQELVLKPAISATGRHTYRLKQGDEAELEAIFARLVAAESMVLQPLQRAILDQGEISLVVLAGQVTHAVRKLPRRGEFRVQDDHGGSLVDHEPTAAEKLLAHKALACCRQMPVYARVDLVAGNSGRDEIMELELVEPELWLRRHPAAANVFAQAIVDAL